MAESDMVKRRFWAWLEQIWGQESNSQGCESSFSKELSSQFKFLGHQELLFSSSSSRCMHELSYSSVQFHPLVWVKRAIDLKAGKKEKGIRTKSSCFAQNFSQHTKVLCWSRVRQIHLGHSWWTRIRWKWNLNFFCQKWTEVQFH